MNILMFISNNLSFDTRVKRHLKTLAPTSDQLTVFLRPIPDESIHLALPNLDYHFFKWVPLPYPASQTLCKNAKEMDVLQDILPACPLLLDDEYYMKNNMVFQQELQDKMIHAKRWEEVLEGIPEEADLLSQIGWVISFMDCTIQWAYEGINYPADVVYCNDIDTLLCGVAHKKKYGSRLIYDEHDIYSDMFPGHFPRMHRNLLALLEYKLLPYVDVLLGVSESEINWIKKTNGVRVQSAVICNCTDSDAVSSFSSKTPQVPLRVYYHGTIDNSRGVAETIKALALVDDVILVLRCFDCDYLETMKELVKELSLQKRVSFLTPVESTIVAKVAREDGDIGIHACSNIKSIDIEVSLTNKFIEYLTAGLPVINQRT